MKRWKVKKTKKNTIYQMKKIPKYKKSYNTTEEKAHV